MRVLLVDDEAPARRKLTRLLGAFPDVEIVGEANSGESAVTAIATLAPDLVFLDIQMPGMGGFAVVDAVGVASMPSVIFVTAYDEHALRAFEVHALDYLLKPVAPVRLREAVERARAWREREAAFPRASAREWVSRRDAVAELVRAREPFLRRMLVHDTRTGNAQLLALDTVELARAERNYITLHTPQGTFRVRGTIAALAARLDPAQFLRVNRSDVVRLDAIRDLQRWSHGDYRVVLRGGMALLWSRRFRAQDAATFELA